MVALVIAIVLWSHVRGEVNPLETATFTVPLQAVAPAGTMIVNRDAIPREVRVTLRAPRVTLREFKGGMSLNPLAQPADVPQLSARYVHAELEFPILKIGNNSAPVKVESLIDDAEVLGAKPTDVVVILATK